ncbi:sodium:proton antiporter [Lutibacter sp. B2]|nr:sodium:proton antiporter [Lutibacter sp. B2]
MKYREVSKGDTYIILGMSFVFIIGCILFNISLFLGFLGSIVFSLCVFLKEGFAIKELVRIMFIGLKECKRLYLFILLIGATISIWLSSGVVPTMMYYGFEYMNGMNFLFASFIVTSLISLFMGTAVGTISTVGIALLGVGKGFGIPIPILLGVIISSAFIADKISPISGLLNLTLSVTKTKYNKVLRSMINTLIPTYLITGLIYYFIGIKYGIGSDLNLEYYKVAILDGFVVSPYLFLFPVFILSMSVLGLDIILIVFLGLFGGMVVSFVLQNMSVGSILYTMVFGYKVGTASSELNNIFASGGIMSMVEVVLIVMGAIALSSLFEGTGLIKPLIDKVLLNIKTKKQLILSTGLISSLLTIITCDQTVGIVLPARVFKDKYDELGLDQTILARTISDTGTIIAPLMPWNVNALIIYVISGVSAMNYAPYAVLCYICPMVTLIVALSYDVES